MEQQGELHFHPLKEEELARLPRGVTPMEHRNRWHLQEEGQVVYLTAWQGEQFVGHVLLTWAGDPHEPMVSHLEQCPHISNFWVQPAYQRQGIGSRMLAMLEVLVIEHGYPRIGLSVGVENAGAQALYRRHGYRDVGLEEFVEVWTSIDELGDEYVEMEICTYLVKELSLQV